MELFYANIALLVAAVAATASMLWRDALVLSRHDFSCKAYYKWIEERDEPTTVKRVILLAVFLAGFGPWSQSAWIVGILALTTLAVTIAEVAECHSDSQHKTMSKVCRQYFITLALAIVIICFVGMLAGEAPTNINYSINTSLIFATFSYAFSLATCWIMSALKINKTNSKNN